MKLHKYINIKTYTELETIITSQDKITKGTLFEEFTYYLFKLHPNYKLFTTNIWLYNDIPQSIKDDLSLPNKDMGIDLLLENNKEYYAIQCKYRKNRDTVVSWKELATFYGLTFGLNNKIKGGFLVTNTYNLHKLALSSTKVTPIYGDFFDDWLDTQFFKNIQEVINNIKLTTRPVFKPREYQYTIINSCINHFKTESRGYLEMICGSGKTLTAYWVDKNMDNKLTLVLVPSLYLLSQFYKDWVYIGTNINFILVGSDADIGEVDYHTNGIILTTDPEIIKSKIKDKTIIISTYQSSDKVIAALPDLTIDLCIFDEAHKTVGQVDKQFSLLISDPIKIKKRLFMTATPKVYASQSIDTMDENILSMDNEEHYGKLIYTYNAGTAINQGYLVDYNIVTMHTDNEYIKKTITDNKYINFDFEDNESHYVACALMLLNSRDMHHHLVTYHNSIKKTKLFKELLESLIKYFKYDIKVLQIDGSYSMSKRGSIIREFVSSKNVILVSAKVLNEGINIPVIDSVCFVDNRTSTIDLIQCIGRSLRLHESKGVANIFVPVLCDSIEVLENCSAYVNLIRILKSLSNIDERIVEYFSGITAGTSVGGKIKMVNYVSNVVISEKVSIDEWCKEVGCVVWQKVDSFEFYKKLLFEYCDVNKRVPEQREKYKGLNVGQWLSTQKKKINNSQCDRYIKLSNNSYVKKCLDEYLNPEEKWEEWKELLFEYCDANKNAPEQKKIYKNRNIGLWLQNQKCKIKDVSYDIYIKLSSNSYVKESLDKYLVHKEYTKDSIKLEWEEWKTILFEYCDVSKSVPGNKIKYKNQNIGLWLQTQKGKIDDKYTDIYIKLSCNDYIKKSLDEYLIYKDCTKDYVKLGWEEWKELLFEYCEVYKRVPEQKEKYKEYRIGGWFNNQKTKINDISNDMYKKLSCNRYVKECLDSYLNPEEKWEELKELLFEYCNTHKNIPEQKIKYKNKNICKWLDHQKEKINDTESIIYIKLSGNNYVKKSLDKYLIYKENTKNLVKLEWDEWKKLLFEYCDINKDIPRNKKIYKNKNIGIWLQNQKSKINDTDSEIYIKLSCNNYVKESLDEYLNPEKKWEEWKELLFEYCNANKCIPECKKKYKDQSIGLWLNAQKGKINDTNSEIYIKLSCNNYVKESLDEYLNPEKKWKEWRELLFEYCEVNMCVPTQRAKYKDQNIGAWLCAQKNKINDTNNDIYIKLSGNNYVKKSIDDYLNKKMHNHI